ETPAGRCRDRSRDDERNVQASCRAPRQSQPPEAPPPPKVPPPPDHPPPPPKPPPPPPKPPGRKTPPRRPAIVDAAPAKIITRKPTTAAIPATRSDPAKSHAAAPTTPAPTVDPSNLPKIERKTVPTRGTTMNRSRSIVPKSKWRPEGLALTREVSRGGSGL